MRFKCSPLLILLQHHYFVTHTGWYLTFPVAAYISLYLWDIILVKRRSMLVRLRGFIPRSPSVSVFDLGSSERCILWTELTSKYGFLTTELLLASLCGTVILCDNTDDHTCRRGVCSALCKQAVPWLLWLNFVMNKLTGVFRSVMIRVLDNRSCMGLTPGRRIGRLATISITNGWCCPRHLHIITLSNQLQFCGHGFR